MIKEQKPEVWTCRNVKFSTRGRILVMGVLNVTPDSFSDGGLFYSREAAVQQAEKMIHDGADILDIGGESSRPGAEQVSLDEELTRILPIIKDIKKKFPIPLSIDTYKAAVAREALNLGVEIINDITGLRYDSEMKSLVAESGAGIVIMHMQGTPQTMQKDPFYEDVVGEIAVFLKRQIDEAVTAGIGHEQIVVDPGIGFGKTKQHNLDILANLNIIKDHCNRPILVGASRKRFIGYILDGLPTEERIYGSVAAALSAVSSGAAIVRVHDVLATRQALRVFEEIHHFKRTR